MSISLNGTLGKYLNGSTPFTVGSTHDNYFHFWVTQSGTAPSEGDGYQSPIFFIEGGGGPNQVGFYFDASPNQTHLHYYVFTSGLYSVDIDLGAISATVPTFVAVSTTYAASPTFNTTNIYVGASGGALSKTTQLNEVWGNLTAVDVMSWSNQEPLYGTMEGLTLIKRALSDAEVNSMYRSIFPRLAVGSDGAFWPLLNIATCDTDIINGNTLTKTGTLTDSTIRPPAPWRIRGSRRQ